MKLYLIVETGMDYSCCYYEGDTPYHHREIVNIQATEQAAEHHRTRLEAEQKKLQKKNLDYRRFWPDFEVEEIDLPDHVIKYIKSL